MLRHDLTRMAVGNTVNFGVLEWVAMEGPGYRSRTMFGRCDIKEVATKPTNRISGTTI